MRLVDAFWEMRNLGVSCVEVEVTGEDDDAEVLDAISDLSAQYLVVRVPPGRVGLVAGLEGRGFNFIETAFRVQHDLQLPKLSNVCARLVKGVTYGPVPHGLDDVARQIHGGMFESDRVFLDSHFTPEQAAIRYVNWMHDEVSRGGTVYELRRGDQGIGFFLFRSAGNVGYSALSGVYRDVLIPGLGVAVLYLTLAEGAKRNLRLLDSNISSNNLAVVRTHGLLGFQIVGIHYVLVRHH